MLITFISTAELHSSLPDSDQSLDTVAKQLHVGQSLEVSCDQLGLEETLEEIFYLCQVRCCLWQHAAVGGPLGGSGGMPPPENF